VTVLWIRRLWRAGEVQCIAAIDTINKVLCDNNLEAMEPLTLAAWKDKLGGDAYSGGKLKRAIATLESKERRAKSAADKLAQRRHRSTQGTTPSPTRRRASSTGNVTSSAMPPPIASRAISSGGLDVDMETESIEGSGNVNNSSRPSATVTRASSIGGRHVNVQSGSTQGSADANATADVNAGSDGQTVRQILVSLCGEYTLAVRLAPSTQVRHLLQVWANKYASTLFIDVQNAGLRLRGRLLDLGGSIEEAGIQHNDSVAVHVCTTRGGMQAGGDRGHDGGASALEQLREEYEDSQQSSFYISDSSRPASPTDEAIAALNAIRRTAAEIIAASTPPRNTEPKRKMQAVTPLSARKARSTETLQQLSKSTTESIALDSSSDDEVVQCDDSVRIGSRVVVHSLVQRAEFNGRGGCVVALHTSSGRWDVQLDQGGDKLRVRETNLRADGAWQQPNLHNAAPGASSSASSSSGGGSSGGSSSSSGVAANVGQPSVESRNGTGGSSSFDQQCSGAGASDEPQSVPKGITAEQEVFLRRAEDGLADMQRLVLRAAAVGCNVVVVADGGFGKSHTIGVAAAAVAG